MKATIGRPVQEKTKTAVSITLDDELLELARAIGKGNISRGVSEVLKAIAPLYPDHTKATGSKAVAPQTQDEADLLT